MSGLDLAGAWERLDTEQRPFLADLGIAASIPRTSHPWWAWEDHKDGMYSTAYGWQEKIPAARGLLADAARLEDAMRAVVDAWPVSAEHQLTNTEQNRRSWLGQAACRLAVQAPAIATRAAWVQLTTAQCDAANASAERVIREWSQDYESSCAGGQMPLCGEEGMPVWDLGGWA